MNIKLNAVPLFLVVVIGILLTAMGIGIGIAGRGLYANEPDASASVVLPVAPENLITMTQQEYDAMVDLIDSLQFKQEEFEITGTDFVPCGEFEIFDKHLEPAHRVGFFDCSGY